MARIRTTKWLAKRIDVTYHKRGHWLRTLKWAGAGGLAAVVVVWLVVLGTMKRSSVYTPGDVAASHALIENNCSICHKGEASLVSRRHAADARCISCHARQAPVHQRNQLWTADSDKPPCGACHLEHRGRGNLLARVPDDACTACHADLEGHAQPGTLRAAARFRRIGSYEPREGWRRILPSGAVHAEFRDAGPDQAKIRLNHHLHLNLKALYKQLSQERAAKGGEGASDPDAAPGADASSDAGGAEPDAGGLGAADRYASPDPANATASGEPRPALAMDAESDASVFDPTDPDRALNPKRFQRLRCEDCHVRTEDGALMQPIRFQKNCASCHALRFDPAQADSVPHERPEVVRAYVRCRYEQILAGRGDDLLLCAERAAVEKAALQAREPSARTERAALEWMLPDTGAAPDPDAAQVDPSVLMVPSGAASLRRTSSSASGVQRAAIAPPSSLRAAAGATGSQRIAEAAAIKLASDIGDRIRSVEQVLYLKTCRQCHMITPVSPVPASPSSVGFIVEETKIPAKWMPGASFDHEPHTMVRCKECHRDAAAGISVAESRDTGDVLIPPKAACDACHRSGAAGATCVDCHRYHPRFESGEPPSGEFTIERLAGRSPWPAVRAEAAPREAGSSGARPRAAPPGEAEPPESRQARTAGN